MGNKIVRSQEWVGPLSHLAPEELSSRVRRGPRLGPDFGQSRIGICSCRFGPERESGKDFGEYVDAIDACAHADPAFAVFKPDHRRLAACPLLLTQTEFCGEHEHDLDFGAQGELLIRVQEDASHAEVARDCSLLLRAVKRSNSRGNLRGDTLLIAAFWLGAGHGERDYHDRG